MHKSALHERELSSHSVSSAKVKQPYLKPMPGRPRLSPGQLFIVGAVVPGQSRLCRFGFAVNDLSDLAIHGFVGYMEGSGFLPHSQRIGLGTSSEFHGD